MTEQPETEPMDRAFWESHWMAREAGAGRAMPAHADLDAEACGLDPGTALDAGCGEGTEAIWLASRGWSVTAADISSEVLARASVRVSRAGLSERIRFVEADLSVWEPQSQFDLVTSHYAHPATPQLAFYERISRWVAPAGTLLVVGHLRTPETGHGHRHGDGRSPEGVTVTAASVTATLDPAEWDVVTAIEQSRTVDRPDGAAVELHDVIVRATRRR